MTDQPKRIQRKRSKGWRMPPNTVSVCRPGKWGNPFRVKGTGDEWTVQDGGNSWRLFDSKEDATKYAVECYQGFIDRVPDLVYRARRDLRGKNLACWCPIGSPCHADVLLEVANAD